MKIVTSLADPAVAATLLRGGIVVARTDTLYGILARANDEQAVKRVFALKDRSEHKSPIVLIAAISQCYDVPSLEIRALCAERWPGPVSILVPSIDAPRWIRRENDSVAYRLPDDSALTALITQTGPLIAPSANPEAHVPAMSVDEAYDYFGDQVDIYVDGGRVDDDTPSQLLRIDEQGNVERLR